MFKLYVSEVNYIQNLIKSNVEYKSEQHNFIYLRSAVRTNSGSIWSSFQTNWLHWWEIWSKTHHTIHYRYFNAIRDNFQIFSFYRYYYSESQTEELAILEGFIKKDRICAAIYKHKWHRARIVDVFPEEQLVKVNISFDQNSYLHFFHIEAIFSPTIFHCG